MKIQIEIDDNLVLNGIIRGIMENFPEASSGCALQCTRWKYDEWQFSFWDTEDNGKEYNLTKERLLATFPLIYTDKWPKGCTQPPNSNDPKLWDQWLCDADATDFDAFAQLACFGEVIYG